MGSQSGHDRVGQHHEAAAALGLGLQECQRAADVGEGGDSGPVAEIPAEDI
jgi:hypothetical protein